MTNNAEHTYRLRVNQLYEDKSIASSTLLNGFSGGDVRVLFDGQEVGRVQPIRASQLEIMSQISRQLGATYVGMPNNEHTRAALLGTVNRQLEEITPVGIDYAADVIEEDGNYTVQVEYEHQVNRMIIDVELDL